MSALRNKRSYYTFLPVGRYIGKRRRTLEEIEIRSKPAISLRQGEVMVGSHNDNAGTPEGKHCKVRTAGRTQMTK